MTEDTRTTIWAILIVGGAILVIAFALQMGWLDGFAYKCPRGEYPVMTHGGMICIPRQGG